MVTEPRVDMIDSSVYQRLDPAVPLGRTLVKAHRAAKGVQADRSLPMFAPVYRETSTWFVAYIYVTDADPAEQVATFVRSVATIGGLGSHDVPMVDAERCTERSAMTVYETLVALYGRCLFYSATWVPWFRGWRTKHREIPLVLPYYGDRAKGWALCERWKPVVWQHTGDAGRFPGIRGPVCLDMVLEPEWFGKEEVVSYNRNTVVPFGYGSQTKTLGELETWLLAHHHPEFVRRLLAWLSFKAGRVGVGGGWRSVQPVRPGFAAPGKSFHQDQTYADGFTGACAVDLVVVDGPDPNLLNDTPRWSDVPVQGSAEAARFGVHANVSTESWHVQPVELDGYDSWVRNGRPAPAAGYKLPDDVVPTPTPTPTTPPDPVSLVAWLDVVKPTVRLGSTGGAVRYLQTVLQVTADGRFGPRTEVAVRSFQTWFGLGVDGIVGRNTWAMVDRLAAFRVESAQP